MNDPDLIYWIKPKHLQEMRAKLNVNMTQMADVANVCRSVWYVWETGKQNPNYFALKMLSDLYKRIMVEPKAVLFVQEGES